MLVSITWESVLWPRLNSNSSFVSSDGVQGWLQGCAGHANFARFTSTGFGASHVGRNDAGDGMYLNTAIIDRLCV